MSLCFLSFRKSLNTLLTNSRPSDFDDPVSKILVWWGQHTRIATPLADWPFIFQANYFTCVDEGYYSWQFSTGSLLSQWNTWKSVSRLSTGRHANSFTYQTNSLNHSTTHSPNELTKRTHSSVHRANSQINSLNCLFIQSLIRTHYFALSIIFKFKWSHKFPYEHKSFKGETYLFLFSGILSHPTCFCIKGKMRICNF